LQDVRRLSDDGSDRVGPRPKAFDANYERSKRSTKEEKRIAKRLGGKRLPRSGGLAWSRHDSTTDGGDLSSKDLHVEHKRVEPQVKSVGIKRDWLAKVTEGAKRRMLVPSMVVTFESPKGHAKDWLLLPLEAAERLMALAEVEDA
jgi:hypothetical protein